MKKSRLLLLLSLLSVVLLFAACSKEKAVDGNVNDKSNVTNQEDTSIKDTKTDESNSSVDDGSDNESDSSIGGSQNSEATNDQENTAKKEAKIIYKVETTCQIQNNDVLIPRYGTEYDEQNRVAKTFSCWGNGSINVVDEWKYFDDFVEVTSTQYSIDGNINRTENYKFERVNYDNGYYVVNNTLYNSQNQMIAQESASTFCLYKYNEKGALIEYSFYNVVVINTPGAGASVATVSLLSELLTKDFSELQEEQEMYEFVLSNKKEYTYDDNGLVKGYTQTVIKENETTSIQFEYKHTLDAYGNPIKTETWTSYPQHMGTVTYEYTYAE